MVKGILICLLLAGCSKPCVSSNEFHEFDFVYRGTFRCESGIIYKRSSYDQSWSPVTSPNSGQLSIKCPENIRYGNDMVR